MAEEKVNYEKILKRWWGYDSFRPLQKEIIDSVCNGKDTLAILPTGGGKSLTYQVPAMVLDGVVLVVSPLIALMTDQVENLKKRGIRAVVLHAALSHNKIFDILEQAQYGAYKLIYVSPERLQSSFFLTRLQYINVSLIAVDEAHCISEWGYDFRPSYLKISDLRNSYPNIPVLALTASATPKVQKDICDKLKMSNYCHFQTGIERDNLYYVVRKTKDKDAELYKILTAVNGSSIVYTRTRQQAEQLSAILQKMGLSANFYHAGLDAFERTKRQTQWMEGKTQILCSTNAFGMGIDKPDVRIVVHYDIPDALEQYYQEAGRAGRDGKKSYAVLLVTESSLERLLHRHEQVFPPKDYVRNVYQQLANFFVIGVYSGEGGVFPFNLELFCQKCRLSYSQVQASLNILQWAGYITLVDEMENASKLKVTLPPSKLYDWRMAQPDNDPILEAFLRVYTGIFSDYQHISEDYIAKALGMERDKIYSHLVALSSQGIVDYIPFKRTPLIVYNTPRLIAEELFIPKAAYESRIEYLYERLLAMYNYVSAENECRSVLLAKYFGQQNPKPCGHCDYCLSKKKQHL